MFRAKLNRAKRCFERRIVGSGDGNPQRESHYGIDLEATVLSRQEKRKATGDAALTLNTQARREWVALFVDTRHLNRIQCNVPLESRDPIAPELSKKIEMESCE